MSTTRDEIGKRKIKTVLMFAGIALALAFSARCAVAQAQPADSKTAEPKTGQEAYQIIYLANLTQQNELNDVQTDLRNMLPKARIYGTPSQNAISIKGTPEDIQLAQKIVSDLDRPRKTYRLTYTITYIDGSKRIGSQHVSLVATVGLRTVLKQGSRVPIITGSLDSDTSKARSQVQYADVGLNIAATLDGSPDSLQLRTKVEQSSVAEQRSGVGGQDPVIRQTVLDETSTLVQGKPLVLGSLDLPDSTRKQEIEVVSELVR